MIKKYLRFYLTLMKFSINLKMIYKTNFWINLITDINFYLMHIIVFITIYSNVESIGEWKAYQVMFFMGTFTIIASISMATFFFSILGLPGLIRTGQFDLFITKPINTLFYVSLQRFEFNSVFNFIFGLIIILYSIFHMDIKITIFKVLIYVFLILLMSGLYYTILAITCTAAFWFVNINSLMRLGDELFSFSFRVPGILYKGFAKFIFFVLIPFGLLFTIPTQFFIGIMSGEYWALIFGVSTGYWLILIILWRKGIRNYSSASS